MFSPEQAAKAPAFRRRRDTRSRSPITGDYNFLGEVAQYAWRFEQVMKKLARMRELSLKADWSRSYRYRSLKHLENELAPVLRWLNAEAAGIINIDPFTGERTDGP